MIQILQKFIKKIYFLCIVFIITSCNEKSILFDTSQIEELDYKSALYISDIDASYA